MNPGTVLNDRDRWAGGRHCDAPSREPNGHGETCDIRALLDKVVAGGYCIGCGVCAAVQGSPLIMGMDEYGMYRPMMRSGDLPTAAVPVLDVCPFSGQGPNEDTLAEEYASAGHHDDRVGYYAGLYAGYVGEGEFRARGASGGLATWLPHELLRTRLVDGVIHVRAARMEQNGGRPLFAYTISRSVTDVLDGAKSRYYPVELSRVLGKLRDMQGRYALIGLPCFIKAVKRLARTEPWVRDRIAYYIGLVCGHLKSAAFAEVLGWQLGIEPTKLCSVDFRVKIPNRPANEYAVQVTGLRGLESITVTQPMRRLLGHDWGQCLFMYPACDYCDDVFAETADVVVGDAWLPDYSRDSAGTNVVVVRHPGLHDLLRHAAMMGRIHLETLTVDQVTACQQGGLRQRREGLAYRIWLKQRAGVWYPPKRVTPSRGRLGRRRRRIYELRTQIAMESHEAFRAARSVSDLEVFRRRIWPHVRRYAATYAPWWRREVKRLAVDVIRAARSLARCLTQ